MSDKNYKIASLILAAGESKRLGKPKQNLKLGNTTLLNFIKEHLNLYFVDRTFIVLGAYANEIVDASQLETSEFVEFKGWSEGMGSSISYACSKIFKQNTYDGIIITLVDLPMITASDYKALYKLFKGKSDIIATRSGETIGVPVLFGNDYFEELLGLRGEKGAKAIIKRHLKSVKTVENDRALIDIDTPEDLKHLNDIG